jgi:hypothetical protein
MLMDSVLYIINNSCNPYISLAFNSALRTHFVEAFCRRNAHKPQTTDVHVQVIGACTLKSVSKKSAVIDVTPIKTSSAVQ